MIQSEGIVDCKSNNNDDNGPSGPCWCWHPFSSSSTSSSGGVLFWFVLQTVLKLLHHICSRVFDLIQEEEKRKE